MLHPHRKKRKSYNEAGHAHFLTFSCWQRLPLLNKDRSRQWMIEAIEQTRNSLEIAVIAYVIMPETRSHLASPHEENLRNEAYFRLPESTCLP